MKLARKIILSLAIMVTMCLASVIVVAGGYNQASAVQVSEKPTTDIVQTEKKKPTTYHFEPGEVVFQRGGNTLNYSYTPSVNVKEEGAKPVAYEYVFGNSIDEPIAVNLKSIDTTGVRVSYAYSHEGKIDDKSSLVGSSEFELQEVENTGDKVWIYIIVHPNETDVPVQFTASIVWWYGIPQDLPIIDNVTGEVIDTQTIVTGQEIEPITLKEPETKPASQYVTDYDGNPVEIPYYFDGWYLDKNFGTRVTDSVTAGAKVYARYANVLADCISGNCVRAYSTNYLMTCVENVVIPAMFNGVTITSVGEFYDGLLKSVRIPNTITTIEAHAFDNAGGSLKNIIFEANSQLTTIEEGAFWASGITNITIPKSVTSIGKDIFAYCESLTSIIVESGNTVYDSRDNCNAIITTATNELTQGCMNTRIPSSVTSIGEQAFDYCVGLTSIIIPSSVTSIGEDAFDYCVGLTSIIIPSSVTSMGDSLFSSCSSLTSVTLSSNLTSIGEYTFYSCSSLTSIIIPEGVTSIGQNAFIYCDGLTSVTLPSSLLTIGESAFYACRRLTSVTIPEGVTRMEKNAFAICDNLKSIIFEDTETWYRTKSSDYTGGSITIVTNSRTNATYFKSSYGNPDEYWYKV